MHPTIECVGCGTAMQAESTDDEFPDVKIKYRRVERECRSCGTSVTGLDAPDTCPNDECQNRGRGFGVAERVVEDAIDLPVCSECRSELRAADPESVLRVNF